MQRRAAMHSLMTVEGTLPFLSGPNFDCTGPVSTFSMQDSRHTHYSIMISKIKLMPPPVSVYARVRTVNGFRTER